jgi:hypothetical protein
MARLEDRFDLVDGELTITKEKLQKALDRCHELELEIQAPDRANDDGLG